MKYNQPEVYRFEISVWPGNDEWWEEVAALPTLAKRKEEVRAQLIRSLNDMGFYEGEGQLTITEPISKGAGIVSLSRDVKSLGKCVDNFLAASKQRQKEQGEELGQMVEIITTMQKLHDSLGNKKS